MAKLWAKGYELDKVVEQFTTGEDYLLDTALVRWDCVGSIAHAAMLSKIGILTQDELEKLKARLREIIELHANGEFIISREDEDVHTAVESDL
ncbi:MAG: argininosuccinate lyase, partial [Pseudomonadota bacterium]